MTFAEYTRRAQDLAAELDRQGSPQAAYWHEAVSIMRRLEGTPGYQTRPVLFVLEAELEATVEELRAEENQKQKSAELRLTGAA